LDVLQVFKKIHLKDKDKNLFKSQRKQRNEIWLAAAHQKQQKTR
jgi:hypothetical protein